MKNIVVINGPNLDRLGKREPHHYGHQTLADLERLLGESVRSDTAKLTFFQSNHEGALIDRIAQAADEGADEEPFGCALVRSGSRSEIRSLKRTSDVPVQSGCSAHVRKVPITDITRALKQSKLVMWENSHNR
jgi:hypothetical protein